MLSGNCRHFFLIIVVKCDIVRHFCLFLERFICFSTDKKKIPSFIHKWLDLMYSTVDK